MSRISANNLTLTFFKSDVILLTMEMLLEYIALSSKLIKLPRHRRRLAELYEALTSGREAVEPEANQRDKHNTPFPYTADEIKQDFDQRVYDGTAQRTPW